MTTLSSVWERWRNTVVFAGVPILVVVAVLSKIEPLVRINVFDLLAVVLLFSVLFAAPYFSQAKWESSTILWPSGSSTSYAIKVRPAKLFGGDWLLITHKGFDSPKRVYPKADITAGFMHLIAVPARLVEEMGEGRILILRGDPFEMSARESDEFMSFPEVRKAFLREKIRVANVSIVYEATDLHEHAPRAHPMLDIYTQNLRDFEDSMSAIVRAQHESIRGELELYGRINKGQRRTELPK